MNWKSEAVERLSRYTAMEQAIQSIPLELKRLEWDSCKIRSSNPELVSTGMLSGPRDDRLINNMIRREELQSAYENAKLWVQTTAQALGVLPQDEQRILRRMYVQPEKGAVGDLCEELGLEQSSIYRKRDHALYRFTMALYGAA